MALSNNRTRKSIKRFTQAVKTLRGLQRIPAPLPRPGSEANKYPNNATMQQVIEERQKAFTRADQFRVDKATIAFFASPYTLEARQ